MNIFHSKTVFSLIMILVVVLASAGVWFVLIGYWIDNSTPTPIEMATQKDHPRWWPTQTVPKVLVRTNNRSEYAERLFSYDIMIQSIAGLAAKSVNEGRGDEMVWVETGVVDVENWLARFLTRHPQVELRGVYDPWSLVDRYVECGLIKGYILYRADRSIGELNQHRPDMDFSVNVATSLAGILEGLVVEESLEAQAQVHGLMMLMDARNKTQSWCFENYRDLFNRVLFCTQDPQKSNIRDLAIAHKVYTAYGYEKPVPDVMKWLLPLSPILGWNGGDEFKTTEMSSRWGHIQTATDWCNNLPVLMAGSEKIEQTRIKNFDPKTIDWNDSRSAVSFIDTDGDNVQWIQGNFFRSADSRNFWGNPERGRIPFGWSFCFAHLSQLCPGAIDYAVSTQTLNDEFIEWGGGYYYPDLFALDRPNRWELLAQHVRLTWDLMKKNGACVIGFNVSRFDSPDALKAYEVIAGQTDGLLGILVYEYDRYEAGAGKRFWIKDCKGVEIPVVTARYLIWNHTNERPRSGTPAKVAREIGQTIESTDPRELPRYDWVNAHVWSWFQRSPGTDEDAENMPQEDAAAQGGARGYSPALWCAERLPDNIRVVGPEELLWRIRMKHDAEQTKQQIAAWEK